MKFRSEVLLSNATMNPEKAGGDDGEVGSALKISGMVLVDDVKGLFTKPEAFEAVLGHLYDDKDELLTRDVEAISLALDAEKVHATLGSAIATEAALLKFIGCKFHSVQLEPQPGRAVKLTGTLYVYPTDEQWAQIKHLLKKTCKVHLSGGSLVPPKEDKQSKLALGGDAVDTSGRALQ